MHIVTRLIALTRGYQLGRQFTFIERSVRSLSPSARAKLDLLIKTEISRAEQCEFPHLYGTPPDQRYIAWGQGTATGFTRAQSDNQEVRLIGMALWLAVVLHETRDSPFPNMQPQHRNVLRLLRELKESAPRKIRTGQRIAANAT